MTVSQIVNDLLEHKMITTEAALVLLKAEAEAIAYRNREHQGFKTFPVQQPYQPPYRVGDADWTWDPNRGPWFTTTSFDTTPNGTGSDTTYVNPTNLSKTEE
jgi:hypothetical protein